MNVEDQADLAAAGIAAAIGEPARARMLYALMDGRARTSTELATIGEVSPSTASIHLQRLVTERLVAVAVQGRYRYYSLRGKQVADVLEGQPLARRAHVLRPHGGNRGGRAARSADRARVAEFALAR
jgi:DNA-binding transcriptional ArsR family regulator